MPCHNRDMDLLADILESAGLRKRILHQRALYQPWALKFPCPQSMGFHVVTQGEAYLWRAENVPPELLRQGDIAFMARGTHHYLSTHAASKLLKSAEYLPPPPLDPLAQQSAQTQKTQNASPLLTVASGAYQLWHNPVHPLFAELPAWVILRSDALAYGDGVYHALQLLTREIQAPGLGSLAVVDSLLDVLFNLILRQILGDATGSQSWAKAAGDPQIGKALQLMHGAPEKAWKLETLAQAVGLSRSGFAQKFKAALGDSPAHYLTTLRMHKAMHELSQSSEALELVARRVGYGDAFGFSKAFKKVVGLSPKAFRQKNEQERELAWRFS